MVVSDELTYEDVSIDGEAMRLLVVLRGKLGVHDDAKAGGGANCAEKNAPRTRTPAGALRKSP